MWRLPSFSRACACVSTSTAIPCRHSLSTISNNAVRFTAPLFNKDSKGWFKVQEGNRKSWIEKSRIESTIEGTSTATTLQNTSRVASNSNSPGIELNEASLNSLIQNYLSFRSSNSSFLKILPPSTISALLDHSKKLDLPLVEKFILSDLSGFRITPAAGVRMLPTEEGITVSRKRVEELKLESEMKGKQKKLPKMEEFQYEFSLTNSLNKTTSRKLLQDYLDATEPSLPLSLTTLYPNTPPSEILHSLWSNLITPPHPSHPPPSLESSQADLELTLSFLIKLISFPQNHLTLALTVFKELVQSEKITSNDLATTPSETGKNNQPLKREIIFRLILLRSIISTAASNSFFPLCRKGLEALLVVRQDLEKGVGGMGDFELFLFVLERGLEDRRAFGEGNYLPFLVRAEEPLLESVGLVKDFLPRFLEEIRGEGLEGSGEVLRELGRALGGANRWDLLTSLWNEVRILSKGGEEDWLGFELRVKLLRFLAGEGEEWGYKTVENFKPFRIGEDKLFLLLARESFYLLMEKGELVEGMESQVKLWFLGNLCNERNSSGVSKDLAIRSYKIFREGRNKIVLNSVTLLTLVRACLPEYGGTSNKAFASILINDFITTLTATASPFSNPERIINNYDLATLAQCYSLIGDTNSINQVYRKLLAQKMLPDSKDLLIILGATARRDPSRAIDYLRKMRKLGIKIKIEMIQIILMNSLNYWRTELLDPTYGISEILTEMKEYDFPQLETNDLKNLLEKNLINSPTPLNPLESMRFDRYYALQARSASGQITTKTLNQLLKNAAHSQNWNLIIYLYKKGRKSFLLQESSLQIVLSSLLALKKITKIKKSSREKVFRFIILESLAPSSAFPSGGLGGSKLVEEKKTLRLLLKGGLLVGDFELVKKVEEVRRGFGWDKFGELERGVESLRAESWRKGFGGQLDW